MEEAENYSVPVRGDLRHAQARETVTPVTPAMLASAREIARLEQDALRAQTALGDAQRRGGPMEIEAAEARYDRAMEAYVSAKVEAAETGTTSRGETGSAEMAAGRTLVDLLSGDPDIVAIKLEAWRELLDFLRQGKQLKLWAFFQNFVAFANRVDPEYFSTIPKKTWAWIFGETRAATSARSKRVAEDHAKKLGIRGYHLLGGTKSEEARRKYAEAQKGNKNRRKAKGGKKG